MANRHLMVNAEKAFREWLDAQPVGTEFTAHQVADMMLDKGRNCEISSNSVRFLMLRFDNVEVKERISNRYGRDIRKYVKARP